MSTVSLQSVLRIHRAGCSTGVLVLRGIAVETNHMNCIYYTYPYSCEKWDQNTIVFFAGLKRRWWTSLNRPKKSQIAHFRGILLFSKRIFSRIGYCGGRIISSYREVTVSVVTDSCLSPRLPKGTSESILFVCVHNLRVWHCHKSNTVYRTPHSNNHTYHEVNWF
jgi:hypothetical protein